MKAKIILLVAAATWGGLCIPFHSTRAQTWTQANAPSYQWSSVASSGDGSKLVAGIDNGGIYTSTNLGSAWTQTSAPTNMWSSVASSADGTILAATCVGPGVYVSTDSGATWMHSVNTTGYWSSVASSADGRKIVAVDRGPSAICSSTNFGLTWTSNSSPHNDMFAIASSANGNRLVAAAANGGPIYTSTNLGVTWTLRSAPIKYLECVASSADGTRLAVGSAFAFFFGEYTNYSSIYVSTNSGATWTSNAFPDVDGFYSIVSSADGSKLVAGGSEHTYVSTNSGVTWTFLADDDGMSPAAISADGNKLIATRDGGIWISQITPTPRMSITSTSDNLKVSWLVPSTNLVIQQSLDLSSWTDMTDTPLLNLTNLQNEVILSPTGSSVFFRLKTP